MNKLWKTCQPAPVLIEKAFLCIRLTGRQINGKKTVKQRWLSGTFLHRTRGITRFSGGKTPIYYPVFCERNEYRFKKKGSADQNREQRPTCSVFNGKPVTKYFSRSCFL
jgi:hypothetical protein